ncbi:centromere protein U isoform X2 [Hyla sarda]|nr:centromere protein U isoform X2 [Hyla sarda]
MSKKVRSPLLKKILAYADISSILKEPGDALQEDVGEDSFNPPLHSTAVYTDDDDPLLTNGSDQMPAKLSSPVPPVVQEKSVKSKKKPATNTKHSAQPELAEPRRTPQKKVHVPEPVSAKKPGTPRNLAHGAPPSLQAPKTSTNRNVTPQKREQLASEPGPNKKHRTSRKLADGAPPSSQASKTTPNRSVKAQDVPEQGPSKKHGTSRNLADGAPPLSQAPKTTPSVVSAKKSKSQGKDQNTSHRKKSRKGNMELAPEDNWSPEDMPKSVRSVNELDVVHFECGKLIEFYREKVDTDVCKKAVDVFSHSFKEQLSTTISDVRKLKDIKRKNAKMHSEIGRKRKRLLEVKNEIIAKRPKLNELQKEYSVLEKNQESLKSARAFFYDLAHLQDVYMKFKAKKTIKHIKETYGTSSLPALCLEAENILKAEQHLHIVNRQLQSIID